MSDGKWKCPNCGQEGILIRCCEKKESELIRILTSVSLRPDDYLEVDRAKKQIIDLAKKKVRELDNMLFCSIQEHTDYIKKKLEEM